MYPHRTDRYMVLALVYLTEATFAGVIVAMKSEMLAGWPGDSTDRLHGLDELLSDHVTLSADEMTLISQQIQLRMQQTQLQVNGFAV